MLIVILFAFISINITSLTAEVFTSLVSMEVILHAEKTLSRVLSDYIKEETMHLNQLKSFIERLENQSQESVQAVKENPVRAYQLIKTLSVDMQHNKNLIVKNRTTDLLAQVSTSASALPVSDDLYGAGAAIFRLQDTYLLSAEAISNASVPQLHGSPPLTAADCYELGLLAYTRDDFYHALDWMREALHKSPATSTCSTTDCVSRARLLEYYSYILYEQGNTQLAIEAVDEWLQLEPGHESAVTNKQYYESQLASLTGAAAHSPSLHNERAMSIMTDVDTFMIYEQLCRQDPLVPTAASQQLTCQYLRHHPMYFLAPLKLETLHTDPWISVYHDVLSDTDIERIKELALPKLQRSGVFVTSGRGDTVNYRISRSAWVSDRDDPLVARLTLKMTTLNNLTSDTAENFQVLNYGLGGHYNPHYDFAVGDDLRGFEPGVGNRIATVICYLTDVRAGGATVFPKVGVTVWPRKGSCAVWFNMLRNGRCDYRTQHAACPVLAGHKWVFNKWFHEKGQELTCSLNADE